MAMEERNAVMASEILKTRSKALSKLICAGVASLEGNLIGVLFNNHPIKISF